MSYFPPSDRAVTHLVQSLANLSVLLVNCPTQAHEIVRKLRSSACSWLRSLLPVPKRDPLAAPCALKAPRDVEAAISRLVFDFARELFSRPAEERRRIRDSAINRLQGEMLAVVEELLQTVHREIGSREEAARILPPVDRFRPVWGDARVSDARKSFRKQAGSRKSIVVVVLKHHRRFEIVLAGSHI